ncbi:unnamed protein product [Closterium sp. Naga37s-1]|nr:unnamed protein product [Closterium sp. Naga37s-1]
MAHVTYLSAEEFERLAADRSKRIAVVDVRDEERQMDGHIHGSVHAPSETFRDHLPHLATRLSNHDAVVFHCALSQCLHAITAPVPSCHHCSSAFMPCMLTRLFPCAWSQMCQHLCESSPGAATATAAGR